ncbi:MAG: endonuclease III [Desulforegulaceae bacterium]|nr:endonuclease III [Desulforegulaceae bacterium]
MTKKRFSINKFVSILENEYKKWNAPVITFIAIKGASPYEILISTLLSLRTKDEVTIEATIKLFKKANTPYEMLKLSKEEIEKLIYPVGFYPTKAGRILQISEILINKYNGEVPDTMEELLELPGVGKKTANLVLAEGYNIPAICVDVHVHRISNRIGYVKTKNPNQTEDVLRKKLPKKYWIIYNEILVAFGQTICRPVSPFCSKCPVIDYCKQIGVDKTR